MLGEIIVHAVFFCVMLLLYCVSFTFPQLNIGGSLGAAWWPQLVLSIGMILTLVSAFLSARKAKLADKDKNGKVRISRDELISMGISSGIIAAGLLLIGQIGFLGIAPLVFFGFLYLLGARKPMILVIGSLGAAMIFSFLFGNLMEVSLPRGLGIFRSLSYYLY